MATMSKVSVRYIVTDVDAAIAFYTERLGFSLDLHPAPGFARLAKGDLLLLLNRPGAGGAGQATPDGQVPTPAAGIASRSRSMISRPRCGR
jgi:catechol 2,3-dioxygenase-like lactoylglutathione lyase family enzyme